MSWNSNTIEHEATLVIASERPDAIAREVAATERLAGYQLNERRQLNIHDYYWDFPDGRLGANHIALRLRIFGEETLITLKGPSQNTGFGGQRRPEIEKPWSKSAFMEFLDLLQAEGLALPVAAKEMETGGPESNMRDVGFMVVQDRRTLRLSRDVVRQSDIDHTVMAELAVDTTTFSIDGVSLVHHEIEIEAKAQGGENVTEALARVLLKRYPEDLRSWAHSKLATGKALSRLFTGSSRKRLESDSGTLSPAAYDLIAAYLNHDESPIQK